MTTYSYKIVLNDSEQIMLKAAMELMITHCQEKIDSGAGAPYYAHKDSAQNVLRKLYNDVNQISGNNFYDK